ncbi:MAG: hypothetical protein EBX52_05045 [Proteobacteria bacterium]|nr:hypothetical protein [Pseudomonadota bacterium]
MFSQVWTSRKLPDPWKGGFRIYLNPSIYSGALEAGRNDRQTFYASFGHFLGYQLHPQFLISTSTHFDAEHRSPNAAGFLDLKRSLPDFFQLSGT